MGWPASPVHVQLRSNSRREPTVENLHKSGHQRLSGEPVPNPEADYEMGLSCASAALPAILEQAQEIVPAKRILGHFRLVELDTEARMV